MRYGMVIDLKRCVSCYACQVACKSENATPPGVLYAWAFRMEQGEYPNARQVYLPMLCNHCAEPSCVAVCPTGATYKSEVDGTVLVDAEKCVGCRACMTACPYHARYYLDQIRNYYAGQGPTPYEKVGYERHNAGTVEKCDFCTERSKRGQEPACVANCPAVARIFGDLDDPDSEVSMLVRRDAGYQLLPELGNDPSVYYLPAERPAKESR
jgi:Fe-S-cluster-containing dehydrogenase component